MKNSVKDPVCHLEVPAVSLTTEYEGIPYAFCSEQCKERFLANPHLYVGRPGHKALGQKGGKLIKRHRFILSPPLDVTQEAHVKSALQGMIGIQEVAIDGDKIEIQYDLMLVTAEHIADKLRLIGIELGGGWIDHIKLALIKNLEETEADSLEIHIDEYSDRDN